MITKICFAYLSGLMEKNIPTYFDHAQTFPFYQQNHLSPSRNHKCTDIQVFWFFFFWNKNDGPGGKKKKNLSSNQLEVALRDEEWSHGEGPPHFLKSELTPGL